MRAARAAMVLALLPLCSACVGVVHGNAGYAVAPANDRQGLAIGARTGVGGEDNAFPALAFRGKFTTDAAHVTPALDLMAVPDIGPVMPYGAAGLHLLQLGSIDDDFAFGMLTPYAEAGLILTTNVSAYDHGILGPVGIVLNGSAEYDVWFTSQPNELFFTATAGLGFVLGAY